MAVLDFGTGPPAMRRALPRPFTGWKNFKTQGKILPKTSPGKPGQTPLVRQNPQNPPKQTLSGPHKCPLCALCATHTRFTTLPNTQYTPRFKKSNSSFSPPRSLIHTPLGSFLSQKPPRTARVGSVCLRGDPLKGAPPWGQTPQDSQRPSRLLRFAMKVSGRPLGKFAKSW